MIKLSTRIVDDLIEPNGLRDCIVCSLGEVKDGRCIISSDTLSDIISVGNASSRGIKSRFHHPGMCTDALGTLVGRFTNFRLNNSDCIADFTFYEVAKKSPQFGDLVDYITSAAREVPDRFGLSIAGNEKTFIFMDNDKPDMPPILRVKGLDGIDFVDSPAATDRLFSLDLPDYGIRFLESIIESNFKDKSIEEIKSIVNSAIDRLFTIKNKRPKDKYYKDLERLKI